MKYLDKPGEEIGPYSQIAFLIMFTGAGKAVSRPRRVILWERQHRRKSLPTPCYQLNHMIVALKNGRNPTHFFKSKTTFAFFCSLDEIKTS